MGTIKLGVSRRTLLKAGAAISIFPVPRVLAQTSEPLKVGFLTVLTGPLAAGGKQQEEGAAFFLKERNGMIAGRKIELITEDTAGNPALAKTKTQELVERHKVTVMIGPLATNEALAMDGYVRDSKVPLITTTSAATVDLKSRAPNAYVLHAFGTAPQVTYPLGDYAAKTLGYKKIAIVAEDFTYGHEGAGGFHLAFEAGGGKIVQKLWPPLNAPEYGPYLAQIKPDVDAIYMGGGVSEMFVPRLAANHSFIESLRRAHAHRVPIYAECGGLMYCARSLHTSDGNVHPMASLLPVDVAFEAGLCHTGYRDLRLASDGILGDAGTALRGHEFHFARLLSGAQAGTHAYSVHDVEGEPLGLEGWSTPTLLASFVHLHFGQDPRLAERFVDAARGGLRRRQLQAAEA